MENEDAEEKKVKVFIQNDCKKHWSLHGGKCFKCEYFNSEKYQALMRSGLQYQGDPWLVILGEEVSPMASR